MQQKPFREPLPLPPILWDAYRASDPFPPSDDKLQELIEDRFVDAYATQITHMQHVAREEMVTVEADINRLRKIAWTAQKSASEQARRTDATRAKLRECEEDTHALRQALSRTHHAIQQQAAAAAASKASLQHMERQHADAKARADKEIAEIQGIYHGVALQNQLEKQTVASLERELASVRAETQAEMRAARKEFERTKETAVALEQAKAGLAHRDKLAEETLREAVQRLEADFAHERAKFLEQDRLNLARVYAIEREAQKEQWGATVGRAITRPQAAASPISIPGSAAHQSAAIATTAAQRLGMLPPGQVVVAARS